MYYGARKRLDGHLNIIWDQILTQINMEKVTLKAFHLEVNEISHLHSTLYRESALR